MSAWTEVVRAIVEKNQFVLGVALFILIAAYMVYRIWFHPKLNELHDGLTELVGELTKAEVGWNGVNDIGMAVAERHAILRAPWKETEARVMHLPHGNERISVMFGPVNDLWNPGRLLRTTMNLAIFEAMPNLLVGVGLLFTFFFLSLALSQATVALTGQIQDQGQIMKATQDLLSTAGAKFTTSLAGLLASIIWTVVAKNRMATLARAGDEVAELVNKSVSVSGAEMATFGQLQTLQKLDLASQEQQQIYAELLDEAKEQTGSFKRFETDLAVSLGNAITSAFTPQMENMTARLISAIDGLREKLGTMNQDALNKMMTDFAGMIKDSTATEMDAFRNSLGKLADRLDNATIALTEGATESGKAIDDASKALTINVNQAAESLVNGAALLDVALLGAKTAINELNQTIDRVTEMGRVGGRQFDLSLAETDAVVEKLRETGEGWTQAVQALNKTSGQLVEVVNSIEELAHEQTAVVNSVREVAPNAMAAVANVSKVLETSALQAEKAMHEARDAMQSTGKTLGGTVTAITEGVAEYSKQVAALHLGMDSQMAKAVGQMGGAIAALQEAVEELSETLEAKMPKT